MAVEFTRHAKRRAEERQLDQQLIASMLTQLQILLASDGTRLRIGDLTVVAARDPGDGKIQVISAWKEERK